MSAKVGYRAGYRDGQASLLKHLERALNQLDALESALGLEGDGRSGLLNYAKLPPPSDTSAYRAARAAVIGAQATPVLEAEPCHQQGGENG